MTAGRYHRHPDALDRSLPDGVVVLGAAGDPVTITGAGADLWALLARPVTFRDAVEALATAYDAPTATVARDLDAPWQRLIADGAVVAEP